MLDTSFWFILTLIPCLLLIVGAWALVVWAVRQPDTQSKLVEQLTTHKKDCPGAKVANEKPTTSVELSTQERSRHAHGPDQPTLN
jgi:hypothetical protein